jgi:hypothetical protein
MIGGMDGEDWRVEVELDDEQHGYSLGERLRSADLDDEARERLGRRVIVTRDGSKLFLYTTTGEEAEEASRMVQELARADGLTAEVRTTRWHPDEEAWRDASVPLPRTEEEREDERERLEERERAEVAAGESYDWHVHVRAPDRGAAMELEQQLRARGLHVERRWRFLTIDVLTEDDAWEIAEQLQTQVPQDDVEVEPTMDVPSPFFVRLRSWL